MFAVTCTHATLDAMIEIIERENEVVRRRQARGGYYTRDLEVTVLLLVLQPKHLLPNNSCLTRYPTQNGQAEVPKLSGGLNRGPARSPLTGNSPRYPSFRFEGNRARGAKLNPYLVILAAEIKFRRYLVAPNAPPLDAEYQALIEKTLKVADLLYWEAVPGTIADVLFDDSNDRMQVDSDGTSESQATHVSEMGFRGEANDAGGSTAQPLKGKEGARRPDVDLRTLLSGRDLPLDSDDRSLLQEMGLSNGCIRTKIDQESNVERVHSWRNTIAP
ncbi:hypothetical protein BJ912DRAFT_1071303 [Pholiota molesta]|nr:hypothetical protein BJ912DRAFT_1071303 [Pholiota molesta]